SWAVISRRERLMADLGAGGWLGAPQRQGHVDPYGFAVSPGSNEDGPAHSRPSRVGLPPRIWSSHFGPGHGSGQSPKWKARCALFVHDLPFPHIGWIRSIGLARAPLVALHIQHRPRRSGGGLDPDWVWRDSELERPVTLVLV